MCSTFMTSLLCVMDSSNLTRHAELERTHSICHSSKHRAFPYMDSRYGRVNPSFTSVISGSHRYFVLLVFVELC